MKKFFGVRQILSILLFLSILFSSFVAYYKIKYWGFDIKPNQKTEIYTIDTHISFKALGKKVHLSFSTPKESHDFKILHEDTTAKGYHVLKNAQTGRIEFEAAKKRGPQNIYYRLTVYDIEASKGKIYTSEPKKPASPLYDDQKLQMAEKILQKAALMERNLPQNLITLFSASPLDETVDAFLPYKASLKERAAIIIELLALKGVSARLVRGIRMDEEKTRVPADLMLEAYSSGKWRLYDLKTGIEGMPKNFVVFQRGDSSLLDVEGGEHSKVRFTVVKSVTPTLQMAEHRAQNTSTSKMYAFSIYNLPASQQNALKWLMVFPLGILVVVFIRNIVGVPTMGTFTPMLIAMSFIETGFFAGLICFLVIVITGLFLRGLLSKLNLLLVPRISSVVITVILMVEVLAVIGYNLSWPIASSAVFFPIIITAWIIERLSIIYEEEGMKNAINESFYTMLTAIITYFVIQSEYIRHFTFAFNEINLVILFIVMLMGTYTGYRLTELKRFYPLIKKEK